VTLARGRPTEWPVPKRQDGQGGLAVLLTIAALYPVLATRARALDRFNKDATPLTLDGMDISPGFLEQLLSVNNEEWKNELPGIEEHYERFGDRLPKELTEQLDALKKRLG